MPNREQKSGGNQPREDGSAAGGLRFYWWGDEETADSTPAAERPDGAECVGGGELGTLAADTVVRIATLVEGRAQWRSCSSGGAGESGIVEIIAVVGGALVVLQNVLKSPGAAAEAWKTLHALFEKMKTEPKDWHASSEVAIVKCLAEVQRDWPGAYTDPDLVRVIEDGRDAAVWADAPVGIHVIVIPDLKHEKTHIFAIDSRLDIHGRLTLDRLTTNAELAKPPK